MEFNLFDAISPIDFRYFGGNEELKKQAEKFLTETAMKKSARVIANKMKDSNPQEWWWSQFVKDDMAIDREKLLGKM